VLARARGGNRPAVRLPGAPPPGSRRRRDGVAGGVNAPVQPCFSRRERAAAQLIRAI
jgi:hypothetical protein